MPCAGWTETMTSLDKYAIRDTIHKAIVRLNVHPVSDTAMNVGGGVFWNQGTSWTRQGLENIPASSAVVILKDEESAMFGR